MIDTHSHINCIEEFTIDEIITNAKNNGVEKIILPAAYPSDIDIVFDIINKYENVYGLLGVHPSEVKDWDDSLIDKIKKYAENKKIVGIGEIGLDYYWDNEPREVQKKWFIRQLELARELDLPVLIHSREAAADTMEIMKEHAKGLSGVIHCYSYSKEMAQEYIKMGFYIGVGGVVTFKNAKKLKEVVENIPLTSIVLETDCPYMAPEPNRGKRNNSAYIRYVAEKIAELKGITYEEVVEQTEKNARDMYRL